MIKEVTKAILEDDKYEISKAELCEAFDEIFQGISNEITTSAFLAALKTLNLEDEILAEIVKCVKDSVININLPFANLFETVAYKQNKEYLDVFLAIDLISSCLDLRAVKYCFSNPQLLNNSFLVLENLGIKVEKFDQNSIDVLEKTNFGYFYLDENEKYLKYTNDVRKNLSFDNILNFTDNFLSPYNIKNQLIGVDDTNLVEKLANFSLAKKNENTIVISSSFNLPFATLEGDNVVAEAWKNKIFAYNLTADLLDLPSKPISEIKTENPKHCAQILKDVFEGKLKDANYYTIILNSAFALYISKKASSLIEGMQLAKKTIDEGKVIEKINQLILLY